MTATRSDASRPMGERILAIVAREPDRRDWPFGVLAARLAVDLRRDVSRAFSAAVIKVYVSRGVSWLSSQHMAERVQRGVWRLASPAAGIFLLKQALGAAELALSARRAIARPLLTCRQRRRGPRDQAALRAVRAWAIWGVPPPTPLAFLRDVSREEQKSDRRPWLLRQHPLDYRVVGRFDRLTRTIEVLLDDEPDLGPHLLEWVLDRVLSDHPGVVLASTVRLDRRGATASVHTWSIERMDEIRDLLEKTGLPPDRLDKPVLSNSKLMGELRRRGLVKVHRARGETILPWIGSSSAWRTVARGTKSESRERIPRHAAAIR